MWGMAGMSISQIITRIRLAGYDGIEFGFPLHDPQRETFLRLIGESGLLTIGQLYETLGTDLPSMKESYRQHLSFLQSFRPLFINAHTGKDHFSVAENLQFIDIAAEMEQESGIPVVHETHRGKFPFCISATLPYLQQRPALQLTADISHFCTVSESYLQDQLPHLAQILQHAFHIHARVGHPQGPQVTDPRLPEWQEALDHHLAWWDAIVQLHRVRGTKRLTITPEFGPAPYMPAAPATKVPLANQWEINVHMMNLLRERYQ